MPESPWFMPPGRVLTGAGANAHCFTFVGIPRQLWTFGQVTTWGQVASGPLAHESIAVVNCLMTSAANHGVKVFWETVYSKDIVEWERRNPGQPPEDNEVLGFRLWLIGASAQYMNMISQINEFHDQSKEMSKKIRLELSPTAWQNSNMNALQRLRGFVAGYQSFCSLDMNVAIHDEEPFSDFVRNNRNSFPAEFSIFVQAEMTANPRHPFHLTCSYQKLDSYLTSSGTFEFPRDVVRRGWVFEMNSFIESAFPAFSVVPNGKDQMMAGLNNLFKPSSNWILPMHQPSALDVMATAREVNVFSGGRRFNEEASQGLRPTDMAPNFMIEHYHGTQEHPDGDKAIGREYPVQLQRRPILQQNMLEHQLHKTMIDVYPALVDASSAVRKLLADVGTQAIPQAWKMIQNVIRLSPDGEPDPTVVRSLALCNNRLKGVETAEYAMEPIQGFQTAHFAFMEIWNHFVDIQSMTTQQAKIAVFLHVSYLTTLLPELYRLRACMIGPPSSGKTRVMFCVTNTLPDELIFREDGTTPAVTRRNAGLDCIIIVRDEEKKLPDMNDMIQEQTAASSGTLQCLVSVFNEKTGKWETVAQQQVRRTACIHTSNGYQQTVTEAGESRRATFLLPRADLQREITKASVIEGTDEEDNYFKNLGYLTMVKPALIDTFLMPGKYIVYNMVIFNLLLRHAGFKVTEKRQTDMMVGFAIGMQLKLFHMHIDRLKVLGNLTEEDYWKSYVMSRYPSFEGIIIAHNLYTQLTGLQEQKERLVSHLGMLVKVTAEEGSITTGEVTTNGAYYQTTVSLTSNASEFKMIAKLVKRLEHLGERTKWIPGDAFIKKQIQNLGIERTSTLKRDPIKFDDGTLYVLKALVDGTPSEGEAMFLRALKEHLAKKDRRNIHPYNNGEINGQREKQAIVSILEVKELFMGESPPEGSGPHVCELHGLEKMIPGTITQIIGLLKQRHNAQGIRMVRIMSGSIYPAEYEAEETVETLPDDAPGFGLSKKDFKLSEIYEGYYYKKGLTPIDSPMLVDWDFLMQANSSNENLDNLDMYIPVYKDFLRVASPSFSKFFVFCGLNPNKSDDERIGFDVESGSFEIKIPQITRRKRRREDSGFSSRSAPRRKNLLKEAGGGILDPDKEFIRFNEKTLNEKECAKMAYLGAGFPPEEFENDYSRLSMETMRIKAVEAAKRAENEYE